MGLSDTERLNPRAAALDTTNTRSVVKALAREELVAVRAVARAGAQIAALAAAAARALAREGRLIYVGAGTSGRLGALDAAECPPTFGSSPRQVVAVMAGGAKALRASVEGAEDDGPDGARQMNRLRVAKRDLVCGISASGGALFVIAALERARARGASTALITCNARASRAASVDYRVVLRTGPEVVAGSTRLKAGTATKLALNAISTAAFAKLGRVRDGRMVAMVATNAKLRNRAVRTVVELTGSSPARARRLLEDAGWRLDRALQASAASATKGA